MRSHAAEPAPPDGGADPGPRAIGVLPDGTPYFAPVGEVVTDGLRVTCHLCGRAFRSVAAHLASHGWTKAQYCEAFGLERSQPLEGAETRKLRATAFSARLIFEAAVRAGSARGRERARTGELTRDAAQAARGRAFPEQRRNRARARTPARGRAEQARANRERADRQLADLAREVAQQYGYASIGELVRAKCESGQSLAAISIGCGLHKDWLSRHLRRLDPAAAAFACRNRGGSLDARWLPVLRTLGFADVSSYLRQRHVAEHASINAIAHETGLSFHTVKAALQRHQITIAPHAAKRHLAERRSIEVAAALGVDSIAAFVDERQLRGLTWREIAAEAGQPQSWLRRRAEADR